MNTLYNARGANSEYAELFDSRRISRIVSPSSSVPEGRSALGSRYVESDIQETPDVGASRCEPDRVCISYPDRSAYCDIKDAECGGFVDGFHRASTKAAVEGLDGAVPEPDVPESRAGAPSEATTGEGTTGEET